MSTVADKLAYRYVAYYADNKVLEQPADDRYSKHDDKAEHNPSAFRDVLEYPSKLLAFGLVDSNNNLTALVDLTDGCFELAGIRFQAHDQSIDLTGKELQVIYYREVRLNTVLSQETGEEVGQEHFVNRYFIGWQVVGEDIKQTIAVA